MSVHKQNSKVIIVGGGIGGLACALSLARAGVCSHVLERRDRPSEDGAGIQIGPNGTSVLGALGVLAALRPFAGVPRSINVVDGNTGLSISALPLGDDIRDRLGSPYWVVHRVDLHTVLYDAACANPNISVEMGTDVSGIEDRAGEDLVVRTGNGARHFCRAVVGADGIWSGVRDHVLGEAAGTVTPTFYGKSAARTVIPMSRVPSVIRRDAVSLWMHRDGHLVCYPIRGGAELAVVAVVSDDTARERWGGAVALEWVLDRMSGFDDTARGLIGVGEDWRVWGLHTFPGLPTWVRGSVGLLGDAAHPVLPFLAQGGVMALEDAYVLGGCLADAHSVDGRLRESGVRAALETYQSHRRTRVFRVQRKSASQGRIYHMAGLGARARDMVLRHGSRQRLMAGYDWLYGWKA